MAKPETKGWGQSRTKACGPEAGGRRGRGQNRPLNAERTAVRNSGLPEEQVGKAA